MMTEDNLVFEKPRFGCTRDGTTLVQWNEIMDSFAAHGGIPIPLSDVLVFPSSCSTLQAAKERAKHLYADRTAKAGIQRIKVNIDEKSDPADISTQLLTINHVATFRDTGQLYIWKEGVYRPGGEAILSGQVESAAKECLVGRIATKHFVAETVAHVQRSTYHDRAEFDSNPMVLSLRNGVLNLETLDFQPHDPKILSTVQLPVLYDANADCPKFKEFLSQVAYAEDIPVIQEFFGYTLWKDYVVHKSILCVGNGRNGKSTLLRVLRAMLGAENISSRSLQDFENRRFSTADLYGKLANIYSDLPDSALTRTGVFKMLTGQDSVTAEFKFKNTFTFTNFAKLVFSCNKIPRADDDTVAFFSRWILLTFPNTFEGPGEKKDLIKELTTEQELSGIFNWSLEGLIRLHTQNWTFTYSKSTEEIRLEYVRKSDPIGAFVMDCLAQKQDGQITKPELYSAFRRYCLGAKLPVTSQETFFRRLPEHVQFTEERLQVAGKRARTLIGIQLQPDMEWGKDPEDPIQEGQTKL